MFCFWKPTYAKHQQLSIYKTRRADVYPHLLISSFFFQGNIMNRTILLSFLMILIIVLSLTAECRARGCDYSFGNKRVAARKCKKHKRTNARFNDEISRLQVARWAVFMAWGHWAGFQVTQRQRSAYVRADYYERFNFLSLILRDSGCFLSFPLKFCAGKWRTTSQKRSPCTCSMFDL